MKLEKEIEQKFCEYAKSKGCYPVKFEDPARRGAPDRAILCPNGRVLFIEFKRPGEAPRGEQIKYMEGLWGMGFEGTYASDFNHAVDCLNDTLWL